jgi:hypothetical protein
MKYFSRFFTLALLSSVPLGNAMQLPLNEEAIKGKIQKRQHKIENKLDFDDEAQKLLDEILLLQALTEHPEWYKDNYEQFLRKKDERKNRVQNNNNQNNNNNRQFIIQEMLDELNNDNIFEIKENNNNNNNFKIEENNNNNLPLKKEILLQEKLGDDDISSFLAQSYGYGLDLTKFDTPKFSFLFRSHQREWETETSDAQKKIIVIQLGLLKDMWALKSHNYDINMNTDLTRYQNLAKERLVVHFMENKDERFLYCSNINEGLKEFDYLVSVGKTPMIEKQEKKEVKLPPIPKLTLNNYLNELMFFEEKELVENAWTILNPNAFEHTMTNIDVNHKGNTLVTPQTKILSLEEIKELIKNKDNKNFNHEMKKYANVFENYEITKNLKANDYIVCYYLNAYKVQGEYDINFLWGDKTEKQVDELLKPGILAVYLRNDKMYCKFKVNNEIEIVAEGEQKDLAGKFQIFKESLEGKKEVLEDRAPIKRFVKEKKYIPDEEGLKFTSEELLFLVYTSPEEKIEQNNNNQKIDANEKDDIGENKNIGWKSIPVKLRNDIQDNFSAKKSILTPMQEGALKVKTDNSLNWRYQVESDPILVNKKAKYKISYQIQMKETDRTPIGLDLGLLQGDRKSIYFSGMFSKGHYNPQTEEYTGQYEITDQKDIEKLQKQSKFSVVIYNGKQSPNLTPEFTIKKLIVEEQENN